MVFSLESELDVYVVSLFEEPKYKLQCSFNVVLRVYSMCFLLPLIWYAIES